MLVMEVTGIIMWGTRLFTVLLYLTVNFRDGTGTERKIVSCEPCTCGCHKPSRLQLLFLSSAFQLKTFTLCNLSYVNVMFSPTVPSETFNWLD